jgi:hypothetical protein
VEEAMEMAGLEGRWEGAMGTEGKVSERDHILRIHMQGTARVWGVRAR